MCRDTRPTSVVLRVATFNPRHGVGRLRARVAPRAGRHLPFARRRHPRAAGGRSVTSSVPASATNPRSIARALAMQHVAARREAHAGGWIAVQRVVRARTLRRCRSRRAPAPRGRRERRVAVLARVRLAGATVSASRARTSNTAVATRANSSRRCSRRWSAARRPRLDRGRLQPRAATTSNRCSRRAGSPPRRPGRRFPRHAPRRRIDWIAVDAGLRGASEPAVHEPVVGRPLPARRRPRRASRP